MKHSRILKCILAAAFLSTTSINAQASGLAAAANDGVVKVVAGSRGGTYTQLTTEMMSVLPSFAKDGRMRVLPMIGVGSRQNIQDLLYLQGVDIAMVQNDVLTSYAEDSDGSIKQRVRYIAKLHAEEFHVLALNDIASINDLAGKKVSFGGEGSGTSMTANNVFSKLGITVEPVYRDLDESIRALKAGEISAMVYVSGKPVSALRNRLSNLDNVKFLSVVDPRLKDVYGTARLTSQDYPNIITSGDVATVKVDAILAVFNFPSSHVRYKNINRFTRALVNGMSELQSGKYHEKWATISPCAQVPGWTRHAIMQEVCGGGVATETTASASISAPAANAAAPVRAAAKTQGVARVSSKSISEQRDLLVKYYVTSGFSEQDAELVVASYDDGKIVAEYSRLFND